MTQTTHSPIADFLDSTHLGPHQSCKQLTLWPLVLEGRAEARGPAYISLSSALEHDLVEVDEVSADGSVPNVLVRNRADAAILVLFGEELRGAKQNRIPNASFLIPARSELVIDVSCVEAGRWAHRRSRGFTASASVVSQKLRKSMYKPVAEASHERAGVPIGPAGRLGRGLGAPLERGAELQHAGVRGLRR